ncbi:SRPBCC family protein [Streptomyces californicus]|uniref:Cyclase n=2 Tax=Streptomyces TaxID=1883 RepID=A0A1V0U4Z5_STRVN|nr:MULTISPECIES: SRPBCC family protein [Streptomyces]ARF60150.1 cyclase [Streptomyces violaceoruber]KOG82448.1 cyclase [Streptomyces griseus subsp. rhodochrous]QRV26077.1 cyclase [Streptomyces californicus]QRV38260.1 cyclase [Streptomyces californicus]QRV39478.1 cyclase [Streptomyces californicus]
MPESTLSGIKNDVVKSPATDRLKDELQNYLRARAEHAVTQLGHRLGDSVSKLAEPGGAGGALKSLAKGGQALGEGKSPGQAALSAGASHLKDTVKDKVKGLFGKGRKSGGGKSKSVTIVEDIDVGVPVREAYDQWTQFQEFSSFAKGVVSVEKADDTTSNWKVKVAKSTRSWKANVTEQVPDERITWTTEGAKGTVKGVVTFHAVTDDLTRVLLVLEYFPKGLFEKTGNIWRAQGRRARLDLKLYRKFIMMRGEATDSWRGEIRDGEVVVSHDEAIEEEEREDERSESEDDAPEDAYEDDEPRDEDGEDDEPRDDHEDGELDEDGEPEDSAYDDEEPQDEEFADEYADEDGEPVEDAEDAEDAEDEDIEPADEADEDEEPAEEYADEDVEDEAEDADVPADEDAEPEDETEEERPARRSRRRAAADR